MAKNFRRKSLGEHNLHPSTQMMSYGFDTALSENAVKPPVFLTSTFCFKNAEEGAKFFDVASGRKPGPKDGVGGLVYSRLNHPNLEIVEDRLALYDGGETALLTASGMAAISAVLLTYLRPGDSLVHFSPLYGGTEGVIGEWLPSWGIHGAQYHDGMSDKVLREALDAAAAKGPVKLVYLETPANPTISMVDLKMCRRVVDEWAAGKETTPLIVVDNTLLGPVFQRPIELGIDLCVYSLTKYVGGHSDLIAGAITGPKALVKPIRMTRSALGFQLDPHSCWMLSRSMETLSIRMERAAQSGTTVAKWLAKNKTMPCDVLHPELFKSRKAKAIYKSQCDGPGSTFSFVVKDDRALAFRILNNLKLFKLAVSLGGTESLVTHPASTTHSGMSAQARAAAGVSEGLIRLSVGLEHPDDLIADLQQALEAARA